MLNTKIKKNSDNIKFTFTGTDLLTLEERIRRATLCMESHKNNLEELKDQHVDSMDMLLNNKEFSYSNSQMKAEELYRDGLVNLNALKYDLMECMNIIQQYIKNLPVIKQFKIDIDV